MSILFCHFLLPGRKFNTTLVSTKTFKFRLYFKYHLFKILTNIWTSVNSKGADFRGKWTHWLKIEASE